MQCLADIQIADPTITSGVMAGGGTASVSHHTWETITNPERKIAAAIKDFKSVTFEISFGLSL